MGELLANEWRCKQAPRRRWRIEAARQTQDGQRRAAPERKIRWAINTQAAMKGMPPDRFAKAISCGEIIGRTIRARLRLGARRRGAPVRLAAMRLRVAFARQAAIRPRARLRQAIRLCLTRCPRLRVRLQSDPLIMYIIPAGAICLAGIHRPTPRRIAFSLRAANAVGERALTRRSSLPIKRATRVPQGAKLRLQLVAPDKNIRASNVTGPIPRVWRIVRNSAILGRRRIKLEVRHSPTCFKKLRSSCNSAITRLHIAVQTVSRDRTRRFKRLSRSSRIFVLGAVRTPCKKALCRRLHNQGVLLANRSKTNFPRGIPVRRAPGSSRQLRKRAASSRLLYASFWL